MNFVVVAQHLSPEALTFLLLSAYFFLTRGAKISSSNLIHVCLMGFFIYVLQTILRAKTLASENFMKIILEKAHRLLEEEKEFETIVQSRIKERLRRKSTSYVYLNSQAYMEVMESKANKENETQASAAGPAEKQTLAFSLDDENLVLINNIILEFIRITQSLPYMDEEVYQAVKKELISPFSSSPQILTCDAKTALFHAERLMHNHYQASLKRCEYYCSSKSHRCEDNQFHMTNKICFKHACPMTCLKVCEICKQKSLSRCGDSNKICNCSPSKKLSRRNTHM